LEDILTSAEKILSYTKDFSCEQFLADETMDAVIRNFEIIGEAANILPDEFRDQHPQIDWHRIKGFRNRLVHDYMGIDYKIEWNIKESFLPILTRQVKLISCNL
jgi:uncharacterized protein with HEPN domain